MHSRSVRPAPFLALPLLLLGAACATTSRQEGAPVQVDAMVTWIERVHVETERARLSLGDSYERLKTLAAGDYTKQSALAAYARFVQAIDAAEQQAQRLRETVEPMQESARPVFEQWQTDLVTIQNERLRQRSEMRLAVARERYEAIAAAATAAQTQFDAYVKDLRDHATFLAHDLNATAIDAIQDEVKLVGKSARDLDRSFESCLAAARAYVEQSALPAAPPASAR